MPQTDSKSYTGRCPECDTTYQARGYGADQRLYNPLTDEWLDYCPFCGASAMLDEVEEEDEE